MLSPIFDMANGGKRRFGDFIEFHVVKTDNRNVFRDSFSHIAQYFHTTVSLNVGTVENRIDVRICGATLLARKLHEAVSCSCEKAGVKLCYPPRQGGASCEFTPQKRGPLLTKQMCGNAEA